MKRPFFGAALTALLLAGGAARAQTAAPAVDVDRTFVIAAQQGNDAELDLARLALKRSRADEARGFAQHMLAEHTALAERFRAVAPHAAAAMPARENDVDRLTLVRLSNLPLPDFDQEYLIGQIGAHITTLGVFNTEAENGRNPALKAFAARELPMLKAHLEQAVDAARHIGGSNPFKGH